MTDTLRADLVRLREDGEHQWFTFDGSAHCYLCGQTLHVPSPELPEFGCLPLADQLQTVAYRAGTFSRATIALLLASAAKTIRRLAAHPAEEEATTAASWRQRVDCACCRNGGCEEGCACCLVDYTGKSADATAGEELK
jgi:hypothetical protein